jgi:hypothetical protein
VLAFTCHTRTQPDDVSTMLAALGMPAFHVMARSAFRMGYVLRAAMIR